jgi:hypothetical protein
MVSVRSLRGLPPDAATHQLLFEASDRGFMMPVRMGHIYGYRAYLHAINNELLFNHTGWSARLGVQIPGNDRRETPSKIQYAHFSP